MKNSYASRLPALACLAAISLLTACSSAERSRALDNPSTPAVTIAMQVCSNCHGLQGISTSPNFPNLAAQSSSYLEAQLKSFKSHGRLDPAGFEYMWGISARLTDAQIEGLARYFSEQKPPPGDPLKIGSAGSGKSIFETGIESSGVPACSGCHGTKGEGIQQFPRLAGQHADYIVKQLIVFQRTDQRPDGSMMKVVAHGLTPENIEQVANYVAALAPAR